MKKTINDVKGNIEIEGALCSAQELPTMPDGFERNKVSCIADNLRGVRVLMLEKVTK